MEDLLRAYRTKAQAIAAEEHFRATEIWSLLTPHQKESDRRDPPKRPAILED